MYDDSASLLTTRQQSAPPIGQPMLSSPMQQYLTIEELRASRNSCWLCGCNWQQDHVSLDCPECGGYALTRPCPNCDGKCKQIWRRDLSTTHDRHKASWTGQCSLNGSCSSMETRTYDIGGRTVTSATTTALLAKHAARTTTGRPELANGKGGDRNHHQHHALLARRSSSCCSSTPSSVASSDSEL